MSAGDEVANGQLLAEQRHETLGLRCNEILRQKIVVGIGSAKAQPIIGDDPATEGTGELLREIPPERDASEGIVKQDDWLLRPQDDWRP